MSNQLSKFIMYRYLISSVGSQSSHLSIAVYSLDGTKVWSRLFKVTAQPLPSRFQKSISGTFFVITCGFFFLFCVYMSKEVFNSFCTF